MRKTTINTALSVIETVASLPVLIVATRSTCSPLPEPAPSPAHAACRFNREQLALCGTREIFIRAKMHDDVAERLRAASAQLDKTKVRQSRAAAQASTEPRYGSAEHWSGFGGQPKHTALPVALMCRPCHVHSHSTPTLASCHGHAVAAGAGDGSGAA